MLLQSVLLYLPYKGLIQYFCGSSSSSATLCVMSNDNANTFIGNNIILCSICRKTCLLIYALQSMTSFFPVKELGKN